MKTCVYDMKTSTGETLSLSLSMSRQYRAKGKYPEAYAACGKVIMGGLDDYMQIADVLYFAYICAAMDDPDAKVMDIRNSLIVFRMMSITSITCI